MAVVNHTDNPKIGDVVSVTIYTTDANGEPFNPYKVNKVTIYYLERGSASSDSFYQFDTSEITVSFSKATPIKVYGTDGNPAYLESSVEDAVITKVNYDDDENELFGTFTVEWDSNFAREGDYFVCWTWEPIIAASTLSNYTSFYLTSNTKLRTTLPTHQTVPGKYAMLMDRYLPEMFKNYLSTDDVTPDVLNRLNLAVADAFTDIEDRSNQIFALLDANALTEALLPYLANLFSWKLKSEDPNLWRRQIKQAVSLYKAKGTLNGLTDALASAGIVLNKLTRYWQIVSPSTWQEAFRVQEDNQTLFELEKTPLTVDELNFSLSLLPAGQSTYTTLDSTYVEFSVVDGVPYMEWVGDFELATDDILKVLYKYRAVSSQDNEDYIRSLQLADTRSEITMRDENICYPLKNWNVRLIADDDDMLDVLCPTRHPFHQPVIFGKVRTEFPYSENIYNMDEYNGSTRDSTSPCDIDKDFKDSCPCCLSSSISLDIDLSLLSNDRILEAGEIVREFIPFHSPICSINYNGLLEDFILPPVEQIEIYIKKIMTDNILNGQMVFNRTKKPWVEKPDRESLATPDTVASASNGMGFNIAIQLYYPAGLLDKILLNESNNVLEILSGLNIGTYSLTNASGHFADFYDPSLVNYPFDQSQFPFRLSNIVYDGSGDIVQDDKFFFTDSSVDFTYFNALVSKNSDSPWKVVVTTGIYAGEYTIYDILPDGSLVILDWSTTSTITGLTYELRDFFDAVQESSTSGKVTVERRGRFITTDNLPEEFLVRLNDYLVYSGSEYKITEFVNDNECYIEDYSGGTVVGIPSLKIYRRLVDNGVGYVSLRGMRLETSTNYYNTLGVSEELEDDQHLENFFVVINDNYYQIDEWDNTINGSGRYEIVLLGSPLLEWGTDGTSSVDFSIVQFLKTSPVEITKTYPTVIVTTLERVDRRGNEYISSTTEVDESMPMSLMAGMLNSNGPLDIVSQSENITYTIQYRD